MQKIIYIDIYYIYIYSCFFTSCIPRSGDLRNTIFVFSWSHLDAVNFFCVGQVSGTSHVAARPKKQTCERPICPSLSRPFAAGSASSLFVVVQSVLDVICIAGTTVVASPVFSPYFCFFRRLVLQKKMPGTRGKHIVCCCLLYFYY